MALDPPIPGARVTQAFGPGIVQEPAMWADGKRAWWNQFAGSAFHAHFHPAIDYSATYGTPIRASEAGTVIESYYDRQFGGGHKVRVQIRPGSSYCSNHMSRRAVTVGQHVVRGQKLGEVGSTGNSTAPHDHFWVGLDDVIGSQEWPTLFDPALFFRGGSMANDPRIQPMESYVRVNGAGINIRGTPDLDVGSANIWATTQADGIYHNGKRKAGLGYQFEFVRYIANDDGIWCKVVGFGRTLYIARYLCHFVA